MRSVVTGEAILGRFRAPREERVPLCVLTMFDFYQSEKIQTNPEALPKFSRFSTNGLMRTRIMKLRQSFGQPISRSCTGKLGAEKFSRFERTNYWTRELLSAARALDDSCRGGRASSDCAATLLGLMLAASEGKQLGSA